MSEDTILAAIAKLREDLGADLAALRTEIGADIATLRAALRDRFARIDTRLSQTTDDITINMSRADRALMATDNTRFELLALADAVAVLTRKQRKLKSRVYDLTRPPPLTGAPL
jgi:hypothetical protein